MDPNIMVNDIIRTANKILKDYENQEGNGIDQDEAQALAQWAIDMDQWLSTGGFLPSRWNKKHIKKGKEIVKRLRAMNDSPLKLRKG